jgi:hypothetical protein
MPKNAWSRFTFRGIIGTIAIAIIPKQHKPIFKLIGIHLGIFLNYCLANF